MVGDVRKMVRPSGFRWAAALAAGSMIALGGAMILPLSVHAAGPPITDPSDPRCQRVDPENVFFINLQTPAAGQAVGPGSTVGSWFSDESGLNKNSLSPGSQFHIVFQLDGPGGLIDLPPDISESFDQSQVFHNGDANKECKIQVNIKSQIPATVNGQQPPAGDYTVTLQAFDDDQTRHPGPDSGTQIWHFSIAAPAASPSPSPTSQTSPTSGTSPASQVLGTGTTGPSLPQSGHPAGPSGPPVRSIAIGVALTLIGLVGVAIIRGSRSVGSRPANDDRGP
jgi:hypothetical protein